MKTVSPTQSGRRSATGAERNGNGEVIDVMPVPPIGATVTLAQGVEVIRTATGWDARYDGQPIPKGMSLIITKRASADTSVVVVRQ
jgi:hypothetical protein